MSAKRLGSRAKFLGFAMALSLAGVAEAQSRPAFAVSPEPNRARQGVQVTPVPTVIASPLIFETRPVAFNLVPTILMSDGTVFANFGFGFEPVVRSCFGPVVTQPVVRAGNGQVISPNPPTFMQPVPAQKTPSQQMVTSPNAFVPIQVSAAAQLSCFSRDASGRVFVFR